MSVGLKRMGICVVERAECTLGESQGLSQGENQDSGKAVKGEEENCNSQTFNFMCLKDTFVLLSY